MTLIIEVTCTSARGSKRFVLHEGETLEIGRSNEELNLLTDARLSRRHFTVGLIHGQIEINHLSKTNPTLVASDGSGDFRKVGNTRTESGGCRVIAGSHRFVMVVEKAESVLEQTMTGEQSDFWSDVDGGSVDIPDVSPPDPIPVRRGSKTVQEHEPPSVDPQQTPKPKPMGADLFDDESSFQTPQSKSEKDPMENPSTHVKKPFFPVTDDFFDD